MWWLSYSVGAISPASTLRYGSILIAVAFKPTVLSSKPVDEAIMPLPLQVTVSNNRKENDKTLFDTKLYFTRRTTYMPLMTPPDTRTYFILKFWVTVDSQQGRMLRSGRDEGSRLCRELSLSLEIELMRIKQPLVQVLPSQRTNKR